MKNEILQELTFYDYSEIEISFSIKTTILDLQSLTELLKLNPTRGWSNGEKYFGKQFNIETKETEKIERQRTCTLYVYETNELVESKNFHDHADHLLKKLEKVKDILIELIRQPDKFEINIHIYLKFDKDETYFGFSSETEILKRLADCCQILEWRNKIDE
jgi:hypothetical protein